MIDNQKLPGISFRKGFQRALLQVKNTVLRIQIRTDRIHFGPLDPDPHWGEYGSESRRAKNDPQSEENSSLEVLDVFF
jgi:hypothetical protein